jgi:hypothetical protein
MSFPTKCPVCHQQFTRTADHRYGCCCSQECAQSLGGAVTGLEMRLTPRAQGEAPRPTAQRRHGTDRKAQTE